MTGIKLSGEKKLMLFAGRGHPELAAEVGLENGGWATIVTPRAAIEARVLVTERVTPLTIAGRTVHQIGLPYHWGVGGEQAVVSGDSANDLLGVVMDPNVLIQESKVGSCAIVAGRRPRGRARLELVAEYRRRAGVTVDTGMRPIDVERGEHAMRQDHCCLAAGLEAGEDVQQEGVIAVFLGRYAPVEAIEWIVLGIEPAGPVLV